MSKSLGNILRITEVAERVPAEALRHLFLGTHYRTPLDFSSGRLEDAARAHDRLYEALARADEAAGTSPAPTAVDGALARDLTPFLTEFCAAMDDDLNAARGLGLVFDRMRELNRLLDAGDRLGAAVARADLARAGVALGLFLERPAAFLETQRTRGRQKAGLSAEDIEAAIEARNAARKRKDFREADAIRARLKDQGIVLEDTASGTLWKVGS
jgi:cysteinyl-tRNA synthetase